MTGPQELTPIDTIDEATIRDLAAGATLLGTGGGGDPRIGELMAIQAVRDYGPVRVVSVDDAPTDGLIVPVAMIGAPTVIVERIPSGRELEASIRGLEQLIDQQIVATMPIEAGGINSTFPIVLAARRGIPLLDGDGMGRAFPEVQMVTFSAGGGRAWPLVLADESGNTVVIAEAHDNASAERLARSVVASMGGSAIVAHYAVDCRMVRRWAVRDSVSLAVAIGRCLRADHGDGRGFIDAIAPLCGARRLFSGKVADVDRATVAGFVRGRLSLIGSDEDAGRSCTVEFQNENLIARVDDSTVAAVPDLISLIDADTGTPLTTEGVRFGLRVHLVGIPSSPLWWSPEALPLVEPRSFGYEMDPVRLEPLP